VSAAARALATLGLLAAAATPAHGAGDVVQAEQFVLRDRQGNVVGAFSVSETGRPGLVLYDGDGTVRVVLDLRPDGSPALILTDRDGKQRLQLGMVGELLSALGEYAGAEAPRALGAPAAEPEGQAAGPRVPYGAMIAAIALLGVTALILLAALVILDRRALRSSQQFQELWVSTMNDRDRERAALRDTLLAQRRVAAAEREAVKRWEEVGVELARQLEHVRGEIEGQLRRLRGR